MSVLTATDLHKSFGETSALDGLSFAVQPGEIFGLIGPDGAGKTTALRVLVGVMDSDSGIATIAGLDVAESPEEVREQVGYMPQHFSLYGDLTVAENLRFYADMHFVPKKAREERLKELFAFSRLEPYANRPAAKLSGGMQKKLALSCAMIHTPKVLLLDEPTTGVDPVSRRELWEILYRFADKGIAMVVCTPYMDEAERCHRVGLMYDGAFLMSDTPQAIIDAHEQQVVELLGVDSVSVKEILSGLDWVEDVYPFGDSLHIATSVFDDPITLLTRTLADAGISDAKLKIVRPTFEDVFMSRIRGLGQ
jgi:drug efflux transport system ATP-binding protein